MRYDEIPGVPLPKKVYTLKEAARLLCLCESTVRLYIKLEKIIGFKVGNNYYVNKEYLDNYLGIEED